MDKERLDGLVKSLDLIDVFYISNEILLRDVENEIFEKEFSSMIASLIITQLIERSERNGKDILSVIRATKCSLDDLFKTDSKRILRHTKRTALRYARRSFFNDNKEK